jgi:hypothetical protein
MDNSLKRSFPLEFKNTDGGGDDDCGCGNKKNKVNEAFDQSSGAASFLQDEKSLLTEEEHEEEDHEGGEHEGEHDEEEEMEETVDAVLNRLLGEENPQQEGLREDWQLNEDDPCWEGYTMVGMKQGEGGEEVPNCVPDEDAEDYDPNETVKPTGIGGVDILDAVLEEQTEELSRLDKLAEEVLNG